MTGRNLALLAGAVGAGAWLALRLYREANAFNFHDTAVLVTGGSRGTAKGRDSQSGWTRMTPASAPGPPRDSRTGSRLRDAFT